MIFLQGEAFRKQVVIALFALVVGLITAVQPADAVDINNRLPSFYPDSFARVGTLEVSPMGYRPRAYIMVGAQRFKLAGRVQVSTTRNQFSSTAALRQYNLVGVTVDASGDVDHIWVLPKGYSKDQL